MTIAGYKLENYIGEGNETNCPHCNTEIEYNTRLWNSDEKVIAISGYCPNNDCPVYRPARKGIPTKMPLRFMTRRLATEDEKIALLEAHERLISGTR